MLRKEGEGLNHTVQGYRHIYLLRSCSLEPSSAGRHFSQPWVSNPCLDCYGFPVPGQNYGLFMHFTFDSYWLKTNPNSGNEIQDSTSRRSAVTMRLQNQAAFFLLSFFLKGSSTPGCPIAQHQQEGRECLYLSFPAAAQQLKRSSEKWESLEPRSPPSEWVL